MNNKIRLITNPMLIGAMELVKKSKTPENMKVFMDELLHAKLISPVVIMPPSTDDENEKARLTVPMIPAPDGKKFLMAFTDVNELKKLKTETPMNILPFSFQDYAVMVAKADDKCDGIVINPQSSGLIVNKAMVAAIMNSVLKKPAEKKEEE